MRVAEVLQKLKDKDQAIEDAYKIVKEKEAETEKYYRYYEQV